MTTKQVSLMFHRVGSKESFEAYLSYLAQTFSVVLPGNPVVAPLSVSLIFDDATVDFYDIVFPLLKKYQLKALLAVPTAYISEQVDLPMSERLLKTYCAGVDEACLEVNTAFCSWLELKEMVDSGWVTIASHTQHHCSVPALHDSLSQTAEIVGSKKMLEQRLGIEVNHFVYPYGHWDRASHSIVLQHYQYAHRIGHALNVGPWLSPQRLLYRVDADPFLKQNKAIQTQQLWVWWWNALWNRIRCK